MKTLTWLCGVLLLALCFCGILMIWFDTFRPVRGESENKPTIWNIVPGDGDPIAEGLYVVMYE